MRWREGSERPGRSGISWRRGVAVLVCQVGCWRYHDISWTSKNTRRENRIKSADVDSGMLQLVLGGNKTSGGHRPYKEGVPIHTYNPEYIPRPVTLSLIQRNSLSHHLSIVLSGSSVGTGPPYES
jgi:hypothetical protein